MASLSLQHPGVYDGITVIAAQEKECVAVKILAQAEPYVH